MRKCRTCNGTGELLVDGVVDRNEPQLTAPVDVDECLDCWGKGEVEDEYEEEHSD